MAFIQSKNPNSNIFAVGWGLGAHLMVKYLGQSKEDKNCGLMAAVAVSNPFCLKEMAINLDRPMYERERREIIKGFQHILMENQVGMPCFLSLFVFRFGGQYEPTFLSQNLCFDGYYTCDAPILPSDDVCWNEFWF